MSGEVPLGTYQLPAAQHSSLNDILQPFKAWSCSDRTYIPNTFEVQRYLDKDPRVRLEEMSNYLLADPSWVVELDKHMFENYDMWYVAHRQRTLNVAYALRRDWSVAGILGGWSFEGVQDMESWIYSGLLYGDALIGAAGKTFQTNIAASCQRSASIWELCAVMVLQNEHVPRWAAKIEWRQWEPNVAIAHMILKALDDIKKGDGNAKPVLKLASLWWPEWMKKTQTLYDIYTLCHGEPDSSEHHTQRAQTIALSHTHASTLLDLPESVMP